MQPTPKQLIVTKEDQYTDKHGYYDVKGDYWQLRFGDAIWLNLVKDFTQLKQHILERIYYLIYETDAIDMSHAELVEKTSPYVTFM